MTVPEGVVAAAIGLASGIVGSLIAPWVNWGVEKVRIRTQARRDLLEAVRSALMADLDRRAFRESPGYARVRPHLSARTRQLVESDDLTIQAGGRGEGVNNYRPRVLDELSSLEAKWGLL